MYFKTYFLNQFRKIVYLTNARKYIIKEYTIQHLKGKMIDLSPGLVKLKKV